MKRLYGLFSILIALLILGVTNASAVDVTLGTGTSTTSTYPFYGTYGANKTQMLFTPTELNAGGASIGLVNSISLYFTAVGSIELQNFTIKAKNTSTTGFPNTSFETTGLTTVYSGSLTPTVTGWINITFDTPFLWDGASHLLLETSWYNSNDGGNGTNTVRYTSTTPNYLCLYKYQDDVTAYDQFTTTASGRSYNRPNVILNISALTFAYYLLNPSSLDLGFANPGLISAAKTFSISGGNLTPAAGNITLTPPTGFQISLDGVTWASSPNTISVPYTASTLAATTIYARFLSPATATDLTGTITVSGGGVSNPLVNTVVNLSGKGILSYCIPSYTSTGYTDIARFSINNVNNVSQAENPSMSNATATQTYNDFKSTIVPIIAEVGVPTQFQVTLVTATTSFSTNYLKTYIDLNRDGEINPVTELVDSLYILTATATANPVFTRTITIPPTAVIGQNTLLRVMTSTTAASTPCYVGLTYGECEDYWINLTTPQAMAFSSTQTSQVSKNKLFAGSVNEKILQAGVIMNGSLAPKSLSSIVFNTNGTSYSGVINPITNAKVYSTGTSGSFAMTTQVGGTIAAPNGVMTFTPATAIELSQGTNYFWLVFDISSSAGLDAIIDAQLAGVYTSDAPTLNNLTTSQSPSGFSQIDHKKFDGSFSGGVQTMPYNDWTSIVLYGTDTDNKWTFVTSGLNPSNAPHSAPSMAHYNSNIISSNNSSALVTPVFPLNGSSEPTNFSLWLYRHESSTSASGSRFMVYMNTQPNLTGATRLLPVGYPTADSINVRYNQGLIPEPAIGWYQYTYNIPANFNTANNYILFVGSSDYYNNIHLDDVTFPTDEEAYMAYDGVDTLGTGNDPAVIGSNNSIVNAFNIKTLSSSNPLSLNNVKITPEGVTNIADITTAKVWYLGATATFNPLTNTLFGSATITSTGQLTITRTTGQPDLTLAAGNNYFAVTYDISPTAVAGRFVDCKLDAISYKRGTIISPEVTLTSGNTWGNHELKAPMAGTYVIGSIPGAHYPSLLAATNDLNALGASANINFAIASDLTETAPVDIFEWTEVGTGNYSLNIYPTGAARTITGPAIAGSDGVITLVGADRVNIDGRIDMTGTSNSLTILNSNASAGFNIFVYGDANYSASNTVVIRNLNIVGSIKTNSNVSGIYVQNPSGNNIQILNNNISNAYYGIFATGLATGTKLLNLNIDKNVIGSATLANSIGFYGLYLTYNDSTKVNNNEVFNINQGTSFDAIYIGTDVFNSTFGYNKVHDLVNGSTNRVAAFGISTSANANLTFANNIIYSVVGNGTSGSTFASTGFYFSSGTNFKLYHNDVNLTGDRSMASGTSSSVTAPSGCVVINSTTVTGLDIRNNIFINNLTMSNSSSTAKNYAIYTSGTSAQFTNINSNVYYANGTASYLGYIGSADNITLGDLQTATTQDAQSISKAITFKSATDLHLDGASALDEDLLCEPIAMVTTDMDGITRRTAAGQAQMGADEVMPTIAFTQDLVNTSNFYCITNPPTEELLQVQAQVTGFNDGIVRTNYTPSYTYTWMENGVVIPDATENTYNLLIVNENRLGNIYQAVVNSFLNTLTSTAKTIRVEGEMSIVTNPVESQLLCTDKGYIDISAQAIGTIDSYGWEKYNTTTHAWTLLSGMIGETLRVQLNNPLMGAGQYRMLVRGPGHCGAASIYSTASSITVVEPVSNVVINANGTVNEEARVNYCVENDVVLTADVESIDGLITGYFWQIKNGNEWSDIDVNVYPTANTPILELLNAKVEESGTYRLRVTGSDVCNILETVSNEINVTVYPYVKVLNHPAGQVVCREEQVMLSVKAEGANQIFQWQKDGQDILVTDNATADKPVFVINSADFDHSGVYRCKIQLDGCVNVSDGEGDGYLYTKSALVYVMSNTRIVTQPASVYANIGGQTSLEVKAHATGAPQDYMAEYQWYRGTEPLIDGTKFSGTRTSVLTIKDVETSDIRNDYSVVVIGKCGAPVRSDDASVKQVNFMITTQPVGQTECEGNTATFRVEATSNVENTTIKYEWYFIDNSNNKILLTETSNTLQVDANEQNVGSYYATVTLLPMNVVENSHAVALTVNKKAEIITQPQSAAITEGAQFTLTVDAVSSLVLDYQWYRNGVEISGARQETYSSTEANAGTFIYTVVISNDCGDVTSLPATISVTASGSMNVNEIAGLQVSEVSPNPVNGTASITLNTNATSNTIVNVIDASGRTVMNIFDGLLSGKQDVKIDATDLSSGIYFISITMNGQTITRQLVVSK